MSSDEETGHSRRRGGGGSGGGGGSTSASSGSGSGAGSHLHAPGTSWRVAAMKAGLGKAGAVILLLIVLGIAAEWAGLWGGGGSGGRRGVLVGGGGTGSGTITGSMREALLAAVAGAERAGARIVEIQPSVAVATVAKEAVTAADEASHTILMAMPLGATPIISEEGVAGGEVAKVSDTAPFVFVDPLDATQEYTEALTQYVTIQLCFVRCGRTVASLLYFPFTGATMTALPDGTYMSHATPAAAAVALERASEEEVHLPPLRACDCDAQRAAVDAFVPLSLPPPSTAAPPSKDRALRVIVTRSHFRDEPRSSSGALSMRTALEVLAQVYPNMVLTRAGGAGYKLAAVVNLEADAYIHDGPIRQWDVCAGATLLRAAGGVVTDYVGNEHTYCTPPPPDAAAAAGGSAKKAEFAVRGIVATRDPALHRELLDVIRGAVRTPPEAAAADPLPEAPRKKAL